MELSQQPPINKDMLMSLLRSTPQILFGRFKCRDIARLGRCDSKFLQLVEILWKQIFLQETGGFCPSNVASWRMLCGSHYVQKRNMQLKDYTPIRIILKNSFPFVLDNTVFQRKEGTLVSLEGQKTIPCTLNTICTVEQFSDRVFVTYDSGCERSGWIRCETWQCLKIFQNMRWLHTINCIEGCCTIRNHFVICRNKPSYSPNMELTLWDIKNKFRCVELSVPDHTYPIGVVANRIYTYVCNEGLISYSLEAPKNIERYSYPTSYKHSSNNEDFQLSEKFIFFSDIDKTFWFYNLKEGSVHLYGKSKGIKPPQFVDDFIFDCTFENIICYDLFAKQIIQTYKIGHPETIKSWVVDGNRICVLTKEHLMLFKRDVKADENSIIFDISVNTSDSINPEISIRSGIIYLKTFTTVSFWNMVDGKKLGEVQIKDASVKEGCIYNENTAELYNFLMVHPNFQKKPKISQPASTGPKCAPV